MSLKYQSAAVATIGGLIGALGHLGRRLDDEHTFHGPSLSLHQLSALVD